MDGRTQYGFVVAANVDDYMSGRIKKHELTRRDKEEDRMKHVRVNNANVEPVFFAFPDNPVLEEIIKKVTATPAEYDFTAPDGFGHHRRSSTGFMSTACTPPRSPPPFYGAY